MESQLTVAQARAQLAVYVPNASSEFIDKLNQVMERYTYSGKWYGSMLAVAFNAVSGIITLPAEFLSILAGKFDDFPVQTLGQFFNYSIIGPCTEEDASVWPWSSIRDLGDGYATRVVQEDDGVIRVYSNVADNNLVCRIFGLDVDGLQIVDSLGVRGLSVTLAAPFVAVPGVFSQVTGFTKPLSKFPVTIQVVPSDVSVAMYELSEYQTWETNPSYHRYSIGPSTRTVKVLCQRRFIKVSAETDVCIPDSVGALKFGLKGVSLEDSGYEAEAEKCWNDGYSLMNQRSKSLRAGAVQPIPVFAWGRGQAIPFTN